MSLPTSLQRLLDRVPYSCSEPGYVRFRRDILRKRVAAVADGTEDGWKLLRCGATLQLADPDPGAADRALAVLFVVGNVSNVEAVERFLSHPDQRLRKAAQTCLFEIKRRPAEA